VTLFVAERPADILPMLRAAKGMEPGKPVYWKRYFPDGRPPSPRRVLVQP